MKRLLGKDKSGGHSSKGGLPESDVEVLVNNQPSAKSEEHYGLFTLHDLSPGEPSAVEYAIFTSKVTRIPVNTDLSVSLLSTVLVGIGEILGQIPSPSTTGCKISYQNNSKTMVSHLELSRTATTPVCS